MRQLSIAASLLVALASPAAAEPAAQEAQALATRAVALLQQGEELSDPTAKRAAYDEGLALARRAVELDDNNADAHFAIFGNHGRLLLLDGVTPNPISLLQVNRELDRALELNPDHGDALAAKGGLYRQLPWALGGDRELAESCLTRAIAGDPDSVGARIELAEMYREQGEPARALPLLRDAVAAAERSGKKRRLSEARELLARLEPGS